MITCRDIINALEQLSPSELAEEWDNVGLLLGRYNKEVKKLVISLDVNEKVVKEAVAMQADMIVTHHPVIFSSLYKINDQTVLGRKLLLLAEHKIACYAMHTNFDISTMGELAAGEQYLDLQNAVPLSEEGIGRIGTLKEPLFLQSIAGLVKNKFDLKKVTVFQKEEEKATPISKVAIAPGSGKSFIAEAFKQKADVLITGDIGHHDGIDAVDMGLNIIDATHYGIEHIFIKYIKAYLERFPDENEWDDEEKKNAWKQELQIQIIDAGAPSMII